MRNLNLLFYKEYYRKLGTLGFQEDVIENNKALIKTCFDRKLDYVEPPLGDACQCFTVKVLYPGLLIGTGIPHGVGKLGNSGKKTKESEEKGNDEDVNLGFSFDYVTGQPYIPGSSVKGVLRSYFKYHAEVVAEILRDNACPDIGVEEIEALEEEIFENGDVFFDAVVCKGDAFGRLIGFDYITPHGSVTKNPTPIRIIKVLPDVCFEFRFRISPKEINGCNFTAKKQTWLFKELILLFGAGAKTNVGYGSFAEAAPENDKDGSAEKKINAGNPSGSGKGGGSKKKKESGNSGQKDRNKPLKGLEALAVLLDN